MSATTTIHRTYHFRLELTSAQEDGFKRFAGARRWAWNWALSQQQEHFAATGQGLPEKDLSARLTALKSDLATAWLKEVDSQLLQQALADLKRGFAAFFAKRARYPRFKSRKKDQARFRISQRVSLSNGVLTVPKMGAIKVRQSQEVEGATKSATFKRDACGHWFVSLVSEVEMPDVPLPVPREDRTVGIDLGLKDAVVTSDGKRVPAPRFYRQAQRQLRRAQRSFSRTRKGSRNRQKARLRVARVHQKIANKRNDFCHKLTTTLVQTHDAVCIEDLHVTGLARTKLAKSMLDASMSAIRRQLEYKGAWYRTPVVAIGRFYPSSRLCYECGGKNNTLTLSDRSWMCPSCGCVLDRDLNAAYNIKREGLRLLADPSPSPPGRTKERSGTAPRETLNACGEPIRPATPAMLATPA